jgi:hypothetical protein
MTEIFAVHVVLPAEIRPTELLCGKRSDAEREAKERSKDPEVLAAGVTRFVLGERGTRRPVALYVRGVRQQVPYVSDDRLIHAGGAGYAPGVRRHA